MKRIVPIIFVICALTAIGTMASWWLAFSVGLTILGTLGYLERAFKIQWSNRWSLCLLVLFLLLSIAYIATSSLKSKRSEEQIADLSKLYKPIEETALHHFPGLPKEEAIRKYLDNISKIEAANKQLKEHSRINEQRISELTMSTKTSQEMASQADRRAAEAARIADEERYARKKIEARLADRSLTDVQLTAIANRLKAFSGQEFGMTTFWTLNEPVSLSKRIGQALIAGGWKFIRPETTTHLLGQIGGVFVYVQTSADERTKQAAASLVSALNKEGIMTKLVEKERSPTNPDNRLQLTIGTKPFGM